MPIFKSKFPDVALPQNATISEFIFNNWTPKEEARLAFIDGFSGEQITFGEFKNLTQKVQKRRGGRKRGKGRGRIIENFLRKFFCSLRVGYN
jgi:hypothetical protein